MVAWIDFLSRMADRPPHWDRHKIATLAHRAEVTEFNEPGGMMDHFSTALGQLIYLESTPALVVRPLTARLGAFVLGDSGEPKDTIRILKRCRDMPPRADTKTTRKKSPV